MYFFVVAAVAAGMVPLAKHKICGDPKRTKHGRHVRQVVSASPVEVVANAIGNL